MSLPKSSDWNWRDFSDLLSVKIDILDSNLNSSKSEACLHFSFKSSMTSCYLVMFNYKFLMYFEPLGVDWTTDRRCLKSDSCADLISDSLCLMYYDSYISSYFIRLTYFLLSLYILWIMPEYLDFTLIKFWVPVCCSWKSLSCISDFWLANSFFRSDSFWTRESFYELNSEI